MTLRMGTVALTGPLVIALLATTAAAQLAPIEIAPGETITGTLDGKDPLFPDDTFYECYVLFGTPGTSALLTMRSAAFDTFLVAIATNLDHCQNLTDADAAAMLFDDDGGGGPNGTDSQLTVTFDATGRILVAANSFEARATGEYTLTVEGIAGGFVPPKGPGAAAAPAPALK